MANICYTVSTRLAGMSGTMEGHLLVRRPFASRRETSESLYVEMQLVRRVYVMPRLPKFERHGGVGSDKQGSPHLCNRRVRKTDIQA